MSHSELLELKRWNTPTIYNGWEISSKTERLQSILNKEQTQDFMPYMGPMVGYAVTVKFEPSRKEHMENKSAWADYREYVASIPGPKIVVVQDMDKPFMVGSFWGEVNSNIHKALGCVGTIVDGAIRDVDEMTNAGFKAIARRLCVSHAAVYPVKWDCPVEVFGRKIQPGQLIHADKHGFLAIPDEDQQGLLEASVFMDSNECETTIAAARNTSGMSKEEILKTLDQACAKFGDNVKEKFGGRGEW